MIKIHDLGKDPGRKKKVRVGRGEGSGSGRTSGHGNKGAQARSGYRLRPGFEGGQTPIQRRLPKHGFTNPKKIIYTPVNLSQLEQFDSGTVIDIELLKEKNLVSGKNPHVKILAKGDLSKKLTVKAHAFSKAAEEKITGLKGECEII